MSLMVKYPKIARDAVLKLNIYNCLWKFGFYSYNATENV